MLEPVRPTARSLAVRGGDGAALAYVATIRLPPELLARVEAASSPLIECSADGERIEIILGDERLALRSAREQLDARCLEQQGVRATHVGLVREKLALNRQLDTREKARIRERTQQAEVDRRERSKLEARRDEYGMLEEIVAVQPETKRGRGRGRGRARGAARATGRACASATCRQGVLSSAAARSLPSAAAAPGHAASARPLPSATPGGSSSREQPQQRQRQQQAAPWDASADIDGASDLGADADEASPPPTPRARKRPDRSSVHGISVDWSDPFHELDYSIERDRFGRTGSSEAELRCEFERKHTRYMHVHAELESAREWLIALDTDADESWRRQQRGPAHERRQLALEEAARREPGVTRLAVEFCILHAQLGDLKRRISSRTCLE